MFPSVPSLPAAGARSLAQYLLCWFNGALQNLPEQNSYANNPQAR